MQQLGKSVASLVYAAVVHWQWTLLVAVHSSAAAAAAAAAPLHQPSWGGTHTTCEQRELTQLVDFLVEERRSSFVQCSESEIEVSRQCVTQNHKICFIPPHFS